jgi:putative autoinducer-2 (AI-2) aldolase
MDWGLQNRLSRMIKPADGRTVMLAMDHGYFLGPTRRLERPQELIPPLSPYCDALAVTRGILRTCVDPKSDVPILLRVSGGASVLNEDLSNENLTTTFEEIIRLNVAAIALSVFVGAPHEHQSLINLSKLVDEGERYGIPVVSITAVGKELKIRDARYLSLACRISAEFGAHMVKTYYCDGFDKVVDGCPVPIVVAGGPKFETEREALELVYNAIQAGAIGCDMGRNIFQADHPVAMIKAVRSIIHGNATVKEALDILEEGKKVPIVKVEKGNGVPAGEIGSGRPRAKV